MKTSQDQALRPMQKNYIGNKLLTPTNDQLQNIDYSSVATKIQA